MKTPIVFLCVLILFSYGSVSSAAIVVSSWSLGVVAVGPSGAEDVIDGAASFPFLATHTVSSGGSSASATYDFKLTGDGGGTWVIDFDLARTGSGSSELNSHIFFEVTEVSSFDADGFIAMVGEGGGDGGRTYMEVKLRDISLGGGVSGYVYQSNQVSFETPNEMFTLGGSGGDDINTLIGELPATLLPGHEYLVQWNIDVTASPSAPDNGATAQGDLSFTIKSGLPPIVPEPSAYITWGLLSLCIGGGCWWRRRAS